MFIVLLQLWVFLEDAGDQVVYIIAYMVNLTIVLNKLRSASTASRFKFYKSVDLIESCGNTVLCHHLSDDLFSLARVDF